MKTRIAIATDRCTKTHEISIVWGGVQYIGLVPGHNDVASTGDTIDECIKNLLKAFKEKYPDGL